MARKHKSRSFEEGIRAKKPPKEFDPKDSKIKALNSWEDVADEVDEFHMNRDKVLLEDTNPQDDEYISSEEEVFAPNSEGDSDEEQEDGDDSDGEDHQEISSDDGLEHWGSNKRAYYGGTDAVETEQDALDEEAEARRIQAKQLAAMSEADFFLDEDEWKDSATNDSGKKATSRRAITEALPIVDPKTLSPEECLKLLKVRNPEFEPLSKEFTDLQHKFTPLSISAQAAEAAGDISSVSIAKFKALSAYLGVLGIYFAVLTSPDDNDTNKVKDHGVMEGLVKCRQVWNQVKDLEPDDLSKKEDRKTNGIAQLSDKHTELSGDVDIPMESGSEEPLSDRNKKHPIEPSSAIEPKRKRPKLSLDKTAQNTLTLHAQKLAETESSLADLAKLTRAINKKHSQTKPKPAANTNTAPTTTNPKPQSLTKSTLDPSDFTEQTHLSTTDAHDKALRRKTLRFYTAQITSKSTRRSRAGQSSGGDIDLPHPERNKDRTERLTNEAIKRGSAPGDSLLDNSDHDHNTTAKNKGEATPAVALDSDEEYYQTIALASKQRKVEKKVVYDAVRETEKKGLQVGVTEVGPDGKRAIGYAIEKNKGLTPHRKKEVRNPRVKKRMKFEAAKKKLKSKKAIYKPLEGAYGGEATGIKKNLVKSVRLS